MRQSGTTFPLDSRRAVNLRAQIRGCWLIASCIAGGCLSDVSPPGKPEQVWGRRGISAGRLQKPRAMAIDAENQLYIVDMTGRIQVFSATGEYLRGWRTPAIEQGKPCGLGFARDGNLLVADTHYFRVLVYTPQGATSRTAHHRRRVGARSGTVQFRDRCRAGLARLLLRVRIWRM